MLRLKARQSYGKGRHGIYNPERLSYPGDKTILGVPIIAKTEDTVLGNPVL